MTKTKTVTATKPSTKEDFQIKKIGANIIATFGKEKVSGKVSKEEAEKIMAKGKLYEKKPTAKGKSDLIQMITPKTTQARKAEEKTEAKIKGLKKLVKKEEKGTIKDKAKVKKLVSKEIENSKSEGKDMLAYTKNGIVLAGFENIVMPDLLVNKVIDFLKANISIKPLLNFWSLCLLNPNEIARTRLFEYLSRHKFIITPSGYFVTYRMVKKTNDPSVFTDAHTGTFKIKVGEIVSISRSECDEDGSNDCSKGLHVGSPDFIGITKGDGYGNKSTGQIGTGYSAYQSHDAYGDQPIIAFVNPMHVVSIPNSETRKLRCCEYFPFKLTTPEEVIRTEDSDLYIFETDYKKVELEQLMGAIDKKALKEYSTTKSDTVKEKLDEELSKLKVGTTEVAQSLSSSEIKNIILHRVNLLSEIMPTGVKL